MPIRQSWVDPNTGATYPNTLVVFSPDQIDPVGGSITFSCKRYASDSTYSAGFGAIQVTGTVVTGQPYASWFGIAVGSAHVGVQQAALAPAASFFMTTPLFSGGLVPSGVFFF